MGETDYSNIHVLLIEDEPLNVVVTEAMLATIGIQKVFTCKSGRSVNETLGRMPRIDLILLDIRLPGEDGYQILARLRQMASLAQVPIVAVTAQVMPDDVARAETAGFDGFIAKPLNYDRFPNVIRRLLAGEQVWETR